MCETNDQLESEIYHFDQEDYLKRMETHHASLGNYEMVRLVGKYAIILINLQIVDSRGNI